MGKRVREHSGTAALVISVISLVVASSGIADAARHAIVVAIAGTSQQTSHAGAQQSAGESHTAGAKAARASGKHAKRDAADRKAGRKVSGKHAKRSGSGGNAKVAMVDGHRLSTKPYPNGLLLLGSNGKLPASALPKEVADAAELGGKTLKEVEPSCPPDTVNLGTWCLEDSPYPLTNADQRLNDYFWASQKCVEEGGWLPTAAQLIGAAKRAKLDGALVNAAGEPENADTATIDEDPTVGLKDLREMSASLTTTAAGSEAAGSEGVSVGSTGDPRSGEPNPVPEPANPAPATLQYVTVYSNGTKGGFAGSEPISEPQSFRCAYGEMPGANTSEEVG